MPLGKKIRNTNRLKTALQSAILGMGLSVSPAQLSAIQEKLGTAFEQLEKKADIKEALDAFGKKGQAQTEAQTEEEESPRLADARRGHAGLGRESF